MANFSLTLDGLVAEGCFPTDVASSASPAVARYRSADGQSWDGEGARPDWLQRAVNAGHRGTFPRRSDRVIADDYHKPVHDLITAILDQVVGA